MTSQAVETGGRGSARTVKSGSGANGLNIIPTDFAALFATCDISDFQFRFIHIPSSKLWLIFSARFQDKNTGFFFMEILLKK